MDDSFERLDIATNNFEPRYPFEWMVIDLEEYNAPTNNTIIGWPRFKYQSMRKKQLDLLESFRRSNPKLFRRKYSKKVSIFTIRISPRPADPGNVELGFKYFIDKIVDLGIIQDDSNDWVDIRPKTFKGEKRTIIAIIPYEDGLEIEMREGNVRLKNKG